MDSQEVLEQYRDQTILITGGAGCIGSNMVRMLLQIESEKAIVLDDHSSIYPWNLLKHLRLQVVEDGILDEEKLKQVFYHMPNRVVHLAAHLANRNSIDHPETDLMVNGLVFCGHAQRTCEECNRPQSITQSLYPDIGTGGQGQVSSCDS